MFLLYLLQSQPKKNSSSSGNLKFRLVSKARERLKQKSSTEVLFGLMASFGILAGTFVVVFNVKKSAGQPFEADQVKKQAQQGFQEYSFIVVGYTGRPPHTTTKAPHPNSIQISFFNIISLLYFFEFFLFCTWLPNLLLWLFIKYLLCFSCLCITLKGVLNLQLLPICCLQA